MTAPDDQPPPELVEWAAQLNAHRPPGIDEWVVARGLAGSWTIEAVQFGLHGERYVVLAAYLRGEPPTPPAS